MSDVKFPLCEQMGLEIGYPGYGFGAHIPYVYAERVEQLLSRGVRVGLQCTDTGVPLSITSDQHDAKYETHTALLIDIKPIAKPERSATLTESQVREACRDYANRVTHQTFEDVINRLFDTNKEGGR